MDITIAQSVRDIKAKTEYGRSFNELVKDKVKIKFNHNIYIYANGTIIYTKRITDYEVKPKFPLYYYCVHNMEKIEITPEIMKTMSYSQITSLPDDIILITGKLIYSKCVNENNILELKTRALELFNKDKENPFCKYIITADGSILCCSEGWDEYIHDVPPEYSAIMHSKSQDCSIM